MRMKDVLSRENTDCLKGLMALAIVAGHLRNAKRLMPLFENTVPGMVLTASGYLAVGVFFFLSAYGLRRQTLQKADYLETFFQRRFVPFYITYLLATALYAALDTALFHNAVTPAGLMRAAVWGEPLVANGWYLQAALLLYLLYWLAYRRGGSRLTPAALLAVYGAICLSVDWGLYCQSALCFGMGLYWGEYQERIAGFADKHGISCAAASFVGFCVTLLPGNLPLLPAAPMMLCKMASACFFTAWVVFSLRYVPINCGVTRFLGRISYEIYVIHGFFISLFEVILPPEKMLLYAAAVYGAAIAGAWGLHFVFAWAQRETRDLGGKIMRQKVGM